MAGYDLDKATPAELRIIIGKLNQIIANMQATNFKRTKYLNMWTEVDNAKFGGNMEKVYQIYLTILKDFLGVMQEKIEGKSTKLHDAWSTKVANEYSATQLLKAFRTVGDFYKGGYMQRMQQGDWSKDLAPNSRSALMQIAIHEVAEMTVGTFVTGYAAATAKADPVNTQKAAFAQTDAVRKTAIDTVYQNDEKPMETVWERVQQVPKDTPGRWLHQVDLQYNYLKQNYPDTLWVVMSFKERDQCMDMGFAYNWYSGLYQKVQLDDETVMVTLGMSRASGFFKGQGKDCAFRQTIMNGGNYCFTNEKTKSVCINGQSDPQYAIARSDYWMNLKVRGGHQMDTRWAWFTNRKVWAVQTSNNGGRTHTRRRVNDQDAVWVNAMPMQPAMFRAQNFLGGRNWYLMLHRQGGKNVVSYDANDFNSIYWQSGGPRVFARTCEEGSKCKYSTLFYKRLTNKEWNPHRTLLENWGTDHNQFHVDFEIYKSYDDMARSRNAFQYCNFNMDGIGFPRNCGLTGSTNDWISNRYENHEVPNYKLWMLDF